MTGVDVGHACSVDCPEHGEWSDTGRLLGCGAIVCLVVLAGLVIAGTVALAWIVAAVAR